MVKSNNSFRQKAFDFLKSKSREDDRKDIGEILDLMSYVIKENTKKNSDTTNAAKEEKAAEVDKIIIALQTIATSDTEEPQHEAKMIVKKIPTIMEDIISLYDPNENGIGFIPQLANEVLHTYLRIFGVEKPSPGFGQL